MPQPRKTPTDQAPAIRLEDLTPQQRDALLRELHEERQALDDALAGVGTLDRELTPHELVVRALLRERDHMEGCPIIADPSRAVGRVEAYNELKPANPARGVPAEPVTVARCIECGGARLLEGRLEDVKIATLEELAGAGELDETLT